MNEVHSVQFLDRVVYAPKQYTLCALRQVVIACTLWTWTFRTINNSAQICKNCSDHLAYARRFVYAPLWPQQTGATWEGVLERPDIN